MKKIAIKICAFVVIAITAISFTGCGMKTATIPEENKIKVSDIDKNSTGVEAICKKLVEKEYVSDNCIKTDASLIGAKAGYRFDNVAYNGSKFSLEIYEYEDTGSELAKSIIAGVKENGSFQLFGRTVSYCYMSDNSKYLLIYPDPKSTSGKGDDEESAKRLEEVLKVVNSQK